MFKKQYHLSILLLCLLSSLSFALSGSGTPADPYVIANRADFDAYCANSAYWGGTVRLDTDIDLTGTTFTRAPIAPNLGGDDLFYDGIAFTGRFNGNGHTITGLKIDTVDESYIGLIGQIDYSGTVEKLGIRDVDIRVWGNDTRCVGGLCGQNHGTVRYCYATGIVDGEKEVGGLCGFLRGTIENSYAIVTCRNGWYKGGLCGYGDSGDITRSYAAGEVGYGSSSDGGLVGESIMMSSSITQSYWDIKMSMQDSSDGGTGKTNDQMRTQATFTSGGWDFVGETANGTADIWKMSHASGSTNGYPMLWWQTDNPDASLTGAGISTNPFIIANRTHFDAFCANSNYWNDCIRLDVDLNLAGTTYDKAPIAPDTEIGATSSDSVEGFEGIAFAGEFDGNGRTITGLTIDGGVNCHLGLFGCIRLGEVNNLTLNQCNISGTGRNIGGLCGAKRFGDITNCSVSGLISGNIDDSINTGGLCGHLRSQGQVFNCHTNVTVSGGDSVGGLVGDHYLDGIGSIMNCSSSGSVSGDNGVGGLCGINRHEIFNCYSSAAVSGHDDVGGLVGYTSGGDAHLFILTVSGCCSTGPVTGSGEHIGGFCGSNQGYLDDCFTTSSVTALPGAVRRVGGFTGSNWNGRIRRCYSTGTITTESGLPNTAGFCGINSIGEGFLGFIENCFWNTQTSGKTVGYYSGSVPQGSQPGVCVGLTTAQMQQQSSFTAASWDFVGETANGTEDIWKMPIYGTNSGFPILAWKTENPLAGSGTSTDPYIIDSLSDFVFYTANPTLWNAHVRLDCNLDLSGLSYTTAPIAPDTDDPSVGFQGTAFTGNFNGNWHRIVGLSITGGTRDYIGLFGRVATGGVVRNLIIRNNTLSGYDYIGGLCGENAGTLQKCSAAGTASGGSYTGGLTGRNTGSITQCSAKCTLQGTDYTGGLVGLNSAGAQISNCYALGACHTNDVNTGGLVGLNDGSVSDSYANCTIDASEGPYGAFCGWTNGSGTFSDCYYDKAYGNDSYATGRTSSQFIVRSTFIGWDFTGSTVDGRLDHWQMPLWTNNSRPILNWQIDVMDIISTWLQNDPLCDLNDDQIVNFEDFAIHITD